MLTDIIESVKDMEDIQPVLDSFLGEVVNGIMYHYGRPSAELRHKSGEVYTRIARIPDSVGTTDESRKGTFGTSLRRVR